ncbi:Conserved_hypothetical protein [Hexamita inflata]|uniref:Transmembrane protein n=1 Tax=Hexamita inflata TaxID=28002 RepID=A0AA86QKK2_9EUKA|nr:Conserved hypothetical protein [Hexamita inflata]
MLLIQYTIQFYLEELEDCYSTKASGTYNANLKTLTLYLSPTNQYQCRVFPTAAVFTIAAYSLNKDIVWVVDNFNYATNTTIVLQNIDFQGAQPQLVEINISSYTHFTIVQLLSLNYQLSALDQCFKSGTAYKLMADEMTLTVVSSGACQLQMFNLKEIQIVMGDFSTQLVLNALTKVLLDGVEVLAFDVNGNFQNYVKDKEIVFSMEGNYVDVMQTPFLSVQLTFLMKVDQLTVQSVVVPDSFIIGYGGQMLSKQGSFPMENEVTMRYTFTSQVIADYAAIIATANQFIFRVSMKIGDSVYTMQQTSTTFDLNRQMIVFKCEGDVICLQNLNKLIAQSDITFQFDLTILTDLVFNQLFVAFVQPYPTCWRNGVARLTSTGLCLTLVRKNVDCIFDQTISSSVILSVRNASSTNLYQYQLTQQMDVNVKTTDYCFTCQTSDCMSNFTSIRTDKDISFLFNASYSTGWVGAPVVKYVEANYKKQEYVTTAIGVIIAVACLTVSVIQMVLFKKKIAVLRKKK